MIILFSKLILLAFVALFSLILAVSMARVFRKAGRSGWAAILAAGWWRFSEMSRLGRPPSRSTPLHRCRRSWSLVS